MLSQSELQSFIRATALCGTFGPLLAGVGSASVEQADGMLATIILILGVGFCFHVFAFVFNDVMDLPIDRTEPRRASFPLISGRVSRMQSLTVALTSVPLGIALGVVARPDGSITVLVSAYLAMAVYDVWGKRGPMPLLTDVAQGLSWAALLWWGAEAAARPTPMTAWLAVSAGLFTLLANGIHGSFRDLANDAQCGARSTAIVLGARALPGGGVEVPRHCAVYAASLHLLVVLTVLASLTTELDYPTLAWIAVSTVSAASTVLAGRAWASRRDGLLMRHFGLLHLASLLLLPLVAVTPRLSPVTGLAIVLTVIGPIAANAWLPGALRSTATVRDGRGS